MNYGIGNVKDKSKSLFTTTTAPTESGGVITLATTDIIESGFKVGDYLAYVDSGNISALYSISAISSGTATLSLVGAFGGGGGGKKYKHIVRVLQEGSYGYTISFETDDNTALTGDTWETYWANHSSLVDKNFVCCGFSSGKNITGYRIVLANGYYKQSIYTDSVTPVNWGFSASSLKNDDVFEL